MEILGLLESAIGLVLIYLVLSLICSAWVEGIVNWTGLRGENLRELLQVQTGGDDKIANLLLAQPQLRSLFSRSPEFGGLSTWLRSALALSRRGDSHKFGFRPPSYIPPDRFARALSEMALGESPERFAAAPELLERRIDEDSIRDHLERARERAQNNADVGVLVIPRDCCNPDDDALGRAARHLSDVFNRLWVQSEGKPEGFLAQIEKWFEDGTDRASGWFKRKLAPKLFWVGLVVAVALNADTLEILARLSSDPELRQAVVESAIDRVEKEEGAQGEFEVEFSRAKQELLQLEPLLGWRPSSLPEAEAPDGSGSKKINEDRSDWILWAILKLIGLLATAIALSLGAPFWFDVLQKLVRIRASVSQADVEERDATRQKQLVAVGAGSSPNEDLRLPGPSADAVEDKSAQVRLASGLVGLAPEASVPDRKNARWMAELASLAYTEQRDSVEEALKPLGLRLERWLDHREISLEGSLKAVDTQAFVASGRDFVVVAFRGTEVEADNPADVLTDLQAWKRPIPEFEQLGEERPPRAHHGFVEALDAVKEELWETLRKLGTDNPGRAVWFVGHSLGGALAVLAATVYAIGRDLENREREQRAEEWLKELGAEPDAEALAEVHRRIRLEASPLPPVGWIYTIGQPAVGDERLAAWLESRFGHRLVRTVNNRDIVTRLPSPLLGYAHAGAELYFDSFGRMKIDPSGWYRGLDVLVVDPGKVSERAKEAAGDHKAGTYIGLLKGRGDRD